MPNPIASTTSSTIRTAALAAIVIAGLGIVVLDDGRHVTVSSHEALDYKQGDRIVVTEHHDALGRTVFTVRQ